VAASYNTVAVIALQGIRQADVRLGESCAVIGLGLIGQLTCLMLRASGINVVGIDINSYAVDMARKHGVDLAFERSDPGIAEKVKAFSGGLGVDAVVITAGSSSLDPINFAGELARKKGRVVVVGAVPTGFDRDPHYYRKELELRMSCSYGPGRYDPRYEEKGVDYPAAYVRWTENRNMQAFQELVQAGKIDLDYLTTHEFPLEEAAAAYDLILKKSEPFLGIVLRYDVDRP
jgi:threonine dehydrogenase-like Zn-dependent dehydrogenase